MSAAPAKDAHEELCEELRGILKRLSRLARTLPEIADEAGRAKGDLSAALDEATAADLGAALDRVVVQVEELQAALADLESAAIEASR